MLAVGACRGCSLLMLAVVVARSLWCGPPSGTRRSAPCGAGRPLVVRLFGGGPLLVVRATTGDAVVRWRLGQEAAKYSVLLVQVLPLSMIFTVELVATVAAVGVKVTLRSLPSVLP